MEIGNPFYQYMLSFYQEPTYDVILPTNKNNNQIIIDHIKTHKLGRLYKTHDEFRQFIKAILALPLLPPEEIEPTFNQLILLSLHVSTAQTSRIDLLKRYLKRTWIKNTSSIELSVYHAETTTNNGAESYHKKVKTYIKTPHPRIWSFIATLKNIIVDYDTDLQRLQKWNINYTCSLQKRQRQSASSYFCTRKANIWGNYSIANLMCC